MGQLTIESKCPDPPTHRPVCVRQGSRRSVPFGPRKCPDRIFAGLRSVKRRVPSRSNPRPSQSRPGPGELAIEVWDESVGIRSVKQRVPSQSRVTAPFPVWRRALRLASNVPSQSRPKVRSRTNGVRTGLAIAPRVGFPGIRSIKQCVPSRPRCSVPACWGSCASPCEKGSPPPASAPFLVPGEDLQPADSR